MKPLRSCPICPGCGSKKFRRISSDVVTVKCLNCGKTSEI